MNTKMNLAPKLISAALITSMLCSCSSLMVSGVRGNVGAVEAESSDAKNNIIAGHKAMKDNSVEVIEGQWVPSKKIAKTVKNAELDHQIVINKTVKSLHDLTSYLTNLTNIPFYVDNQIAQNNQQQNGQNAAGAGAPMPMPMPQAMPGMPGSTQQMQNDYDKIMPKNIEFSGSLESMLNTVLPTYGFYWEYLKETGSIRLFKYQTKTFRISALPGDVTYQSNIENTSSGSSSTSGAGGGAAGGSSAPTVSGASYQKTGVTSTSSVWTSIEKSVLSMLSPGGKVVMSAATGTITVTDLPSYLSSISKYIDEQNASMSKQVVINVRILSVDLSKTDGYGVNWNAVYNSATKLTGALTSGFTPISGGGNLSMTIPSGSSSLASGSNAIFTALSTQGDVSELTSASLTTMNNQPAPTQIGSQISYLQSSTTTVTQGAGSTTTLVPGTVNVGFALNVVPHILENDDLLLQYSIDISTLVNMATVTSGTSSIQTPSIDSKNILNRVRLRSGETLALSGFEKIDNQATTNGIGSADNLLAGGSLSTEKSKSVLVVLIEPVIVDRK